MQEKISCSLVNSNAIIWIYILIKICFNCCIRKPLQALKTQMKCSIMHKGKTDLQTKEYIFFESYRYVYWTIPSLLYQNRRKNPFDSIQKVKHDVCRGI